jgi:hypothetical protein
VKITKLLRRGFDRDYGDVDVLAWDRQSKRVLVVECKDVQYRKTLGEISEQLADFRGELTEDRKPDLLKRHLDRVDIIRTNADALASAIGFSHSPIIESHLIFRNPVPMQFAWRRMEQHVKLHVFSDMKTI